MDKFLVESNHAVHNCKLAVKSVQSLGYLNNFEWGCKDGVHTGWAIIEAENASEALGIVPALIRDKARAVRLTQFDPSMVSKWGLDE